MKKYVVDASVILKWVLGKEREPDHEKAMKLLQMWTAGDIELLSPELWKYEVGNLLERVIPDLASEKMSLLLDLKIRDVGLSFSAISRCFSLMKQSKVTFYDAAYFATTYEVGGTLITADENFARKVKEPKKVSLIEEL